MQTEFWLDRWQKNEIGFHQPDGNTYLHRYWCELAVPTKAQVFVPLCGKSRDLLWLRSQGHPVLGSELAPTAVRDFFAEAALPPKVVEPKVMPHAAGERWQADGIEIISGDFFALSPADLNETHAVFDRAALVALPPPMRARYAVKMAELVKPNTQMLLVTMEYDQAHMAGPPFAVLEDEVRALYASRFKIELLTRNNVLSENSRFRDRGLTYLHEAVYRLRKQ